MRLKAEYVSVPAAIHVVASRMQAFDMVDSFAEAMQSPCTVPNVYFKSFTLQAARGDDLSPVAWMVPPARLSEHELSAFGDLWDTVAYGLRDLIPDPVPVKAVHDGLSLGRSRQAWFRGRSMPAVEVLVRMLLMLSSAEGVPVMRRADGLTLETPTKTLYLTGSRVSTWGGSSSSVAMLRIPALSDFVVPGRRAGDKGARVLTSFGVDDGPMLKAYHSMLGAGVSQIPNKVLEYVKDPTTHRTSMFGLLAQIGQDHNAEVDEADCDAPTPGQDFMSEALHLLNQPTMSRKDFYDLVVTKHAVLRSWEFKALVGGGGADTAQRAVRSETKRRWLFKLQEYI